MIIKFEKYNESIFTKNKDKDLAELIEKELKSGSVDFKDNSRMSTNINYYSDLLKTTVNFIQDYHQKLNKYIILGIGDDSVELRLNFFTKLKLYNLATDTIKNKNKQKDNKNYQKLKDRVKLFNDFEKNIDAVKDSEKLGLL